MKFLTPFLAVISLVTIAFVAPATPALPAALAPEPTEGDQLIRIWGADTGRQNGFNITQVPGIGPVPNAKIKITRNEDTKLTLYEMAIPRAELKLFDPKAGRCRFGFIVRTSGAAKGLETLNWGDAAGVFDHWMNTGSFPPNWAAYTACQT